MKKNLQLNFGLNSVETKIVLSGSSNRTRIPSNPHKMVHCHWSVNLNMTENLRVHKDYEDSKASGEILCGSFAM